MDPDLLISYGRAFHSLAPVSAKERSKIFVLAYGILSVSLSIDRKLRSIDNETLRIPYANMERFQHKLQLVICIQM